MTRVLQLRVTTSTDSGAVHTVNADTLCVREPSGAVERVQKGSIWVIADGVGAETDGLRASRLAARVVVDAYWNSAIPSVSARLRTAVERANALLVTEQAEAARPVQAGATILAAVIAEDRLHLTHVGRSRAYLLRGGRLRRLTEDHTWVAEEIRAGHLPRDAERNHPRRNLITRCLGIQAGLQVDGAEEPLEPNDVVLFCSDGLWREVQDGQVRMLLEQYGADAADALVEEAKRLGGRDNITAVTIGVGMSPQERTPMLDRVALLNRLGRELTMSLDLDKTVHSVIQQLLTLTGGDRAAILLQDERGRFVPRVAHSVGSVTHLFDYSHSVAEEALRERKPIVIDNALDDPRFQTSASIIDYARRSILCIPLIAQEDAIGVLYVDSSTTAGIFDQSDLDLLVSFASQAAAAIQNARLHEELLRRTREVELARTRQDSIFRSLSSALVATDNEGNVTHWNPAAEQILGVQAEQTVGAPLRRVLPPPVASWLSTLMLQAQTDSHTILMGHQWEGALPGRERVILAGRVAQIRDQEGEVTGFVFVLNDRTDLVLIEEARRAERTERHRLRDLFNRYMAPAVVDRLLQSPETVRLGGSRQDVTILFADVRGFTGLSERRSPEEVVAVLNRHLALAITEIFRHYGTLDKFTGDGVMAIFGAPLPSERHALAAVETALAIRSGLDDLRRETGVRAGFGIGLNSGQAIVGNIGTDERMSFTAVGDVVNVAAKLQSEARSGEILITDATLERIADQVDVEELGPIYVKGRTVAVNTYKILRVKELP